MNLAWCRLVTKMPRLFEKCMSNVNIVFFNVCPLGVSWGVSTAAGLETVSTQFCHLRNFTRKLIVISLFAGILESSPCDVRVQANISW